MGPPVILEYAVDLYLVYMLILLFLAFTSEDAKRSDPVNDVAVKGFELKLDCVVRLFVILPQAEGMPKPKALEP